MAVVITLSRLNISRTVAFRVNPNLHLFSRLVTFFFLVFSPTLFPYHQLIPLLCPLFSNPLFPSFISSVENGISANILPCSHFSFASFTTPLPTSILRCTPWPPTCAFSFLPFSSIHSSHLSCCSAALHPMSSVIALSFSDCTNVSA